MVAVDAGFQAEWEFLLSVGVGESSVTGIHFQGFSLAAVVVEGGQVTVEGNTFDSAVRFPTTPTPFLDWGMRLVLMTS